MAVCPTRSTALGFGLLCVEAHTVKLWRECHDLLLQPTAAVANTFGLICRQLVMYGCAVLLTVLVAAFHTPTASASVPNRQPTAQVKDQPTAADQSSQQQTSSKLITPENKSRRRHTAGVWQTSRRATQQHQRSTLVSVRVAMRQITPLSSSSSEERAHHQPQMRTPPAKNGDTSSRTLTVTAGTCPALRPVNTGHTAVVAPQHHPQQHVLTQHNIVIIA